MVPQPKARQSTWASDAYHSLSHTVFQTPRKCTSTCPSQESLPPVRRKDWCSVGVGRGGAQGQVRILWAQIPIRPDAQRQTPHTQLISRSCVLSLRHPRLPLCPICSGCGPLHPCYTKCGHGPAAPTAPGILSETQNLKPSYRPTESEPMFNKIPPTPAIPLHLIKKHWLDQNFMASPGLSTASPRASLPPSPLAALNQITSSHSGSLTSHVTSSRKWAGSFLQPWIACYP